MVVEEVGVLLVVGKLDEDLEGVGLGVLVAVRVVAVSGVESRHLAALGTYVKLMAHLG